MASLLHLVSFAGLVLCAPQVRLGNTMLIGRDVTILHQDFFGGEPFHATADRFSS